MINSFLGHFPDPFPLVPIRLPPPPPLTCAAWPVPAGHGAARPPAVRWPPGTSATPTDRSRTFPANPCCPPTATGTPWSAPPAPRAVGPPRNTGGRRRRAADEGAWDCGGPGPGPSSSRRRKGVAWAGETGKIGWREGEAAGDGRKIMFKSIEIVGTGTVVEE